MTRPSTLIGRFFFRYLCPLWVYPKRTWLALGRRTVKSHNALEDNVFGLGDTETKRLAVTLLRAVDHYLSRYGQCPSGGLADAIPRELPDGHFDLSADSVQIAPPELPAFQFFIAPAAAGAERPNRALTVFGRRDYVTFGLDAAGPKSEWFCYAGSDLTRAGKKAAKLVRVLDTHHGVLNADAYRR